MRLSKMNIFFCFMLVFFANKGHGQLTKAEYASLKVGATNVTDAKVWDMLQSGIGTCRVTNGVQGATYCKHYFTGVYSDTLGYNGLPVYNNTDPSSIYYSASSRVTGGGTLQHSTGCFPNSTGGGSWTSTTGSWGGNNTSENTGFINNMQGYARALLIQMINDPANPCGITADFLSGIESSTATESTGIANSVRFARIGLTTDPNPKACYTQLRPSAVTMNITSCTQTCSAPGTISAVPYKPLGNETICKHLFDRLTVSNVAAQVMSAPELTLANWIQVHFQDFRRSLAAQHTAGLVSAVNSVPGSLYLTAIEGATLSTAFLSHTPLSIPATQSVGSGFMDNVPTIVMSSTNADAAVITAAAAATQATAATTAISAVRNNAAIIALPLGTQQAAIMAAGTTAVIGRTPTQAQAVAGIAGAALAAIPPQNQTSAIISQTVTAAASSTDIVVAANATLTSAVTNGADSAALTTVLAGVTNLTEAEITTATRITVSN